MPVPRSPAATEGQHVHYGLLPTFRARKVRAIILPFLLLLAGCFVLAGCLPPTEETTKQDKKEPKPPNVVFILTDDLDFEDVNSGTLKHMPNLRALMEEGTTFENAFATNSLCCPSRATILRGQYTHNHHILHNQPPLGGAKRFRSSGATALRWQPGSRSRATVRPSSGST